MKRSVNDSRLWPVWAASVVLAPATVCTAGPNLVAIGNYGEVPYKRAVGRDSFSKGEVVYSFDDPDFDFGRIVVRSSEPNSVVRRDLLVYYSGQGLMVDTRGPGGSGGGVKIDELEIWLKVKGKIRPGRRYEWEVEGTGAQEIKGGVPAIIPVLWAGGKQIGVEVNMHTPGEGPAEDQAEDEEEDDRIRRLLFPHGIVTMGDFGRQSGAAWIVMKPRGYGAYFLLQRLMFREIDDDPATSLQSAMPIPIRYIPIRAEVEDEIGEALERAAAALKRYQNPDHYWAGNDEEQSVLVTALVVSALAELNPGAAGLDESMQWLSEQEPDEDQTWNVPTVGARLFCLARHGGLEDYRQVIHADVQFLAEAQLEDGGWSERGGSERTVNRRGARGTPVHSDNYHSLNALMALREARFAGVEIDKRLFRRVMKYWIDAQAFDGGFREKLEEHGGLGQATTSAYTAAGAASLIASLDLAAGIGARGCSKYLANRKLLRAAEDALAWLDKNYQERFKNMGSLVGGVDPYAEPSQMQELGGVSGIAHFNDKDHFTKSAESLLSGYDQGSGMFGVRGQGGWLEAPSFFRTANALLILGAGAAPTVCQRIVVGDNEDHWAQYSSDVQHLVRYLSARRGRPFNWRRTSIDREVRELVKVPILIVDFVGPPDWTEEQWNKIREYCFAGGTVVLNLAEGQEGLRDAVLSALRQTFPEYELADVSEEHAIFSRKEQDESTETPPPSAPREPEQPPAVQALGNAFRAFLFLPAQSWSCHWHLYDVEDHENTFAFMDNLLTYATDGTELRSSFAPSTYAVNSASIQSMNAHHIEVGGAVVAYPNLVETMDRLMKSNYRLQVTPTPDADILWVSVTGEAAPSEAARAEILGAVRSGRYLFVDVTSGREDWDENFRAALLGLDPAITLEKLRRTDPAYTGEIPGTQGFDVVEVGLRKALHTRFSTRGRCDLYGIRWNDKPAGVYSAYDISSGIGYHYYPECRGVMPKRARQIAMNAFLTAYGWKVAGQPGP